MKLILKVKLISEVNSRVSEVNSQSEVNLKVKYIIPKVMEGDGTKGREGDGTKGREGDPPVTARLDDVAVDKCWRCCACCATAKPLGGIQNATTACGHPLLLGRRLLLGRCRRKLHGQLGCRRLSMPIAARTVSIVCH